MKKRLNATAVTPRESKINDAHRILNYDFKNDTCYSSSIYFWIPGVNPRKGNRIDIKLYDRKYSSVAGITVAFQTQITDVVDVGDYLYDESNNTYWLCTESFNVEGIHFKGKLTQCNWYLRWQKKDGTILEYPCQDINSTQYNSGISGNNIVTLGSAQHMETVQATEDTLALASPQRFYISRTNDIPYIITQNDTTAYNYGKGLCRITVTQDQNRSDKDRPDLGICDYHSPTDPPVPPEPNKITDLSISITGGTTLRCVRAKNWTVKFVDKDDNEVADCDFKWNVISDFKITQMVSGQKIQLRVDDEDCIDSSFLLQVIDVNDVVMSEVEITVIAGL